MGDAINGRLYKEWGLQTLDAEFTITNSPEN